MGCVDGDAADVVRQKGKVDICFSNMTYIVSSEVGNSISHSSSNHTLQKSRDDLYIISISLVVKISSIVRNKPTPANSGIFL